MQLVVATACPTLATGGSSEDDDLSECHFPVLPMAHGGDGRGRCHRPHGGDVSVLRTGCGNRSGIDGGKL